MSERESRSCLSGGNFFSLLGLLFIGLKLTGHIAWSWTWVLAPFWLPGSVALILLAFLWITVVISGNSQSRP